MSSLTQCDLPSTISFRIPRDDWESATAAKRRYLAIGRTDTVLPMHTSATVRLHSVFVQQGLLTSGEGCIELLVPYKCRETVFDMLPPPILPTTLIE